MITDSQYMRFQALAGGVSASNLELIKVCYSRLSSEGKSSTNKYVRKVIYRELVLKHNRVRQEIKA